MNPSSDLKMNSTEVPKPEPSFYERPESKWNPISGSWFAGKRKVIVAVIVLILCGIFGMLWIAKPSEKIIRVQRGENRETVTREAMEQAIEEARPSSKVPVKPVERPAQGKSKRNYSSEMAVFIYKDQAQVERRSDVRESRRKETLGLPSGTRIPALLSNRIFSFNVAAPVLASVEQDFKWKDQIVIPKGSKFLGEANVLKSIDRINVNFSLLIFPDGKELKIQAMVLTVDGSGGIKGKVEKHRDLKFLKAIGETLVGGASLFVGGLRNDAYSLEDQMRMNLTQNLTSQAAQDLRNVRVDQSITVEAYTPVDVMLLEAI